MVLRRSGGVAFQIWGLFPLFGIGGVSSDASGMFRGRLALCNGISDCGEETGVESKEGRSAVRSRFGIVAS